MIPQLFPNPENMKNFNAAFTLSLMIITFQTGFTQTEPIQGRVTNVFKVNLLMPGFSYEQKLGFILFQTSGTQENRIPFGALVTPEIVVN